MLICGESISVDGIVDGDRTGYDGRPSDTLNWGLEVGTGGARRRQRRFQYTKGWKRRQRQHRQIGERIIVEGGQVGRGGMRVVTAIIVVSAGDRVAVVVEDGMRIEVCAGLGPHIIFNDGTNSINRWNTICDGYGDSRVDDSPSPSPRLTVINFRPRTVSHHGVHTDPQRLI